MIEKLTAYTHTVCMAGGKAESRMNASLPVSLSVIRQAYDHVNGVLNTLIGQEEGDSGEALDDTVDKHPERDSRTG